MGSANLSATSFAPARDVARRLAAQAAVRAATMSQARGAGGGFGGREEAMGQQADAWGDKFGEDYTKRNPSTPEEMQGLYRRRFGCERTAMNEAFLGGIPLSARVLEVGCNVGMQLNLLTRMGFKELYGAEINRFAIERSRELNRGLPVSVVQGTAQCLPFRDGFFDLVYTSGVLIHIHPDDIPTVMREMARCSRRWIWGFEYFAERGHVEIPYRGQANLLWKTNFAMRFVDSVPGLRLVKEARYDYLRDAGAAQGLQDQMYLLEKG